MMDIAHHPLGKGLIFIGRMILGLCVAIAGIFGGVVGAIIGGLVAGYILKKHFFWVLLIPIVGVLASAHFIIEPDQRQEIPNIGYAMIFLGGTFFPAYAGAFFGFLTSLGVSAWRARSQ